MNISRLSLALLIAVGFSLSTSPARAQSLVNDGVYYPEQGGLSISYDDGANSLRQDAGFRVETGDLTSSFVLLPLAQRLFTQAAPMRANMPTWTPGMFRPLVTDIANFMARKEKERGSSVEKTNGISNWDLAIKVTRLAFCFGTDPRGVAAQLLVESSFDRNKVSPTGAVGFTQMTSAAIDEVNDQLGSRGPSQTRIENVPYLSAAIRCYLGGRPFAAMFQDGTIPKGKLVARDARLRKAAKNWIRASIDRDLIYGQITLKVLLANAKDHGLAGERAYRDAFVRYNGEPGKGARTYSNNVMSTMRTFQ